MGNGLEDGKMKNMWLQSLSSHTFSVLFNHVTLPLPLIVSRFAFLLPRFPFLLGASLIIAVNWHSTQLCYQVKRQYAKYYDNQLRKAKLHSIWAFIEWLIHLSFCLFVLWISFTLAIAIIPLGFRLAILYAQGTTALPDVGKCTFMEYFCDATKCQTVFVKTLQKDPNGDCRYRTVVRNAKKLSVIEAGHLRECKNTEFVWELRKTGVAKAAIKRAVHLLECAEENFHCACALLAVMLFLTYPLTVFLDTP